MDNTEYKFSTINKNSEYWNQVILLAKECDNEFYPPLSERMPINEYFEKFNNQNGFVTIVTQNEKLIGSSCGYLFHSDFKVAYSQFTLIDKNYRNKILARELINYVFKVCKDYGAYFIQGRTWSTNFASRKLIKDTGFYQINVIPNDRPNNIHTYEFEKCLFENDLIKNIKRLGILGGMGSSASAKFLSEICMLSNQTEKEQEQLPIILHSETTTADRTELILSNKKDLLAKYKEILIVGLFFI